MNRKCKHEGCDRVLGNSNINGYCKDHVRQHFCTLCSSIVPYITKSTCKKCRKLKHSSRGMDKFSKDKISKRIDKAINLSTNEVEYLRGFVCDRDSRIELYTYRASKGIPLFEEINEFSFS